jgi:hypothetical protein
MAWGVDAIAFAWLNEIYNNVVPGRSREIKTTTQFIMAPEQPGRSWSLALPQGYKN